MIAACGALSLLCAAPVTALPYNWGESSATGYGSTAKASGIWSGAVPLKYENSSSAYLNNADNHTVYVKTRSWANAGSCSKDTGGTCKINGLNLQDASDSRHSNASGRWVSLATKNTVPPEATEARLGARVMIDIPVRRDIYGNELFTPKFNI